ncbi:hypothetical protein [Ferrovibrio sp.]|uniref:hypothetical protein n=1 Tax=Ferrovibrio sp. TaxID=1917215 RepID=UPI003D13246B
MAGLLPRSGRSSELLPRRIGSALSPFSRARTLDDFGESLGLVAQRLIELGGQERDQLERQQAEGAGVAEGLAAGNEGRAPVLRQSQAASDLAFNKAVGTAYFTRRQLDIDVGVAGAVEQFAKPQAADLGGYDAALSDLRGRMMAVVPPAIAPDFQVYFDRQAQIGRLKVAHAVRGDAEARANATHLEAFSLAADEAAGAWRAGNLAQAEAADLKARIALDARSDLTPQAKAELALKLQDAGRRQLVLGGFDKAKAKGLASAEAYAEMVRGRDDLDPTMRNQAADWMQAHLTDLRRQRREQDAEAKAGAEEGRQRWLSDFTLAFGKGERGAGDIEQAYQDGRLKPQERTHFHQELDRIAAGREKVEATFRDQQAKADRDAFHSDLKLAVEAGEAGSVDVDNAYARGLLTPEQRTELRLKADKGERGVARVHQAWLAQMPLDPKSAEDRQAVDRHFQSAQTKLWADLPAPIRAAREVDYATQIGLVPPALASRWRVELRTTDPDRVAAAAGQVMALEARNPALLNDLPREDVDLAGPVMERLRLGLEPRAAAVAALKAREVPAAEAKARLERLKDEPDADRRKWLEGELTGGVMTRWATGKPGDVTDGLFGDFNAAYQQEFAAQGDAEVAKRLALARVRRIWAVTEADGGGRRWMRFAPEAVYGSEHGVEWYGEQLRDDLKAINAAPAEGQKLRLEADPLSAQELGGMARPAYRVLRLEADGAWAPLLDAEGQYLRWRPDWERSAARERLVARARQAIERRRELLNAPPLVVVP